MATEAPANPYVLLADELRRRARGQRSSADRWQEIVDEHRDLAVVLDLLADRAASGAITTAEEAAAILSAARPPALGLGQSRGEDSEIDRLRRVFGIGTEHTVTAPSGEKAS